MKYLITHTTEYGGSEPVSVGHNKAWLKPRSLPFQDVRRFQLNLEPLPSVRSELRDCYGNNVHLFSFNQGYSNLTVTSKSEVTVSPGPSRGDDGSPWESIRESLRQHKDEVSIRTCEFVFDSPRIRPFPELAGYAQQSFSPGRPIVEAALDLTSRIFEDFSFDNRATTVTTPVETVFEERKGVCQDFAHLQIAMLRSVGLAARYVSGYLRTIPPEGFERLVGADASHAWVSLYCGESIGWLDLDPTNNLIPSTDHVTIAWGRDYGDVCPLQGVFVGGGNHTLEVSVDVEPLD